jgi:hypothetical protein
MPAPKRTSWASARPATAAMSRSSMNDRAAAADRQRTAPWPRNYGANNAMVLTANPLGRSNVHPPGPPGPMLKDRRGPAEQVSTRLQHNRPPPVRTSAAAGWLIASATPLAASAHGEMPHIQWQTSIGNAPMRCHSNQDTPGQRLPVPETRWHRTAAASSW